MIILKIEKNKKSKLSFAEKSMIIKKYCNNESAYTLAEKYQVSYATILSVVNKILKDSFSKGFNKEYLITLIKNAKVLRYEEF